MAGDISRVEARDQVARIVSTGHHRRRWAVTLGWGVMGTGIALTLGGSPVVCLLALTAMTTRMGCRGASSLTSDEVRATKQRHRGRS